MYFDDSHTEVKVTDVTHCDLETKSILKPPKARAPLQEVDLGNHITVDFDVIRKRRVSFAGVNKIKEFNSEAKSFSICSTPAYEEKVSTSSDSSALSTSVSGNINSLTKENDTTILDDTMDLTDLSIVQVSAMDMTGIKPQKPLQGVPDIFAPRSQGSGLFSSQQGIDRPVFDYGINNLNNKGGLETNAFQTKPEKSDKPEEAPLVLDPRKMLLNELLEESAVDCSIDNYLKANTLFAQNACNLPESMPETKKPLLDVSEMDFTQALAEPIKPESRHVQPLFEKRDLDNVQVHAKIISSGSSNLFSPLDLETKPSVLQDNVVGTEFPKPLQKQNNMFSNFNESRSTKMDASHMEFTEALPSKNFNPVDNNLAASNYIQDRTLTRANNSPVEKLNPAQNINLNSNYNDSRFGNNNASQMEFTEALPSKNFNALQNNLVASNYIQDRLLTRPNNSQMEKANPSQNKIQGHMNLNSNYNESRLGNNNASQMEFTEALPSKNFNPVQNNLIASNYIQDRLLSRPNNSHVDKPNPSPTMIQGHMNQNSNYNESRYGNNGSQMEFTEALPPKYKNVIASSNASLLNDPKSQIILQSNAIPNVNINETITAKSYNASQMEFTEALPSKNILKQNLVTNSLLQIQQTKLLQKSMPNNHMIPNFNQDQSRFGINNTSQMEFTEALPAKNIMPQNFVTDNITKSVPNQLIPNYNTDESRLGNMNTSVMEFTEALPPRSVVQQRLVTNIQITTSVSQIEHSIPYHNMIPNRAVPNFNIDQSRTTRSNNASMMEFTEALPSRNVQKAISDVVTADYLEDPDSSHLMPLKNSQIMIQNDGIPALINQDSKSVNPINGVSQKKLLEAPTLEQKTDNIFNNFKGDGFEEKPNFCDKSGLLETNGALRSTEAPTSHNIVANNVLERPDILHKVHPNSQIPNLYTNKSISSEIYNASQMEFTEALPSKKLPYNNIAPSNDSENRFSPHSNMGEQRVNLNSEKVISNNHPCQEEGNIIGFDEKTGEMSQMELTEAVPPMFKMKKRQSTCNFTGNLAGFHRNASQKNVVIDTENIPPSQDLNESNSMDVSEVNFADSESGTFDENAKTDPSKPTNDCDVSNMEFTQGLPVNMVGKTGQNVFSENDIKKINAFPTSAADNIFGNSSGMEFTSVLPPQKQPGQHVVSAVQNAIPEVKNEIEDKPNVLNTMDITVIDHPCMFNDMKENKNIDVLKTNKLISQPAFDSEQSVTKNASQMEFTEALPVKNIQGARYTISNLETSSKTIKNNVLGLNFNLQTSNMEFTEVLPMRKTVITNSKEPCESISPSCEVLQNKITKPELNMNDSCSMDVTDIENVPDNGIFKMTEGPEILDKNKVNILPTGSSDVPKFEVDKKLSNDYDENSPNFPCLSGPQNNLVTVRQTSGASQNDFSQLEFTEALPARNVPDVVKRVPDIFSNENPFTNVKKSIMASHENGSLSSSNMEFTEFIQKPNAQHFISAPENKDEQKNKEENKTRNEVFTDKESFDNLGSGDVDKMNKITKDAIVEKMNEVNTQDGFDKHVSYQLEMTINDRIDKPQAELLSNSEQDCKTSENMFPVTNKAVSSSLDTTVMDFTEAVQPEMQFKENIKQIFSEKRSGVLFNPEIDVNRIPDASQMEFTEAIPSLKPSELCPNVKDTEVDNEFSKENSFENRKMAFSESKEFSQQNYENKLDYPSIVTSDKQDENISEINNSISENIMTSDVDHKKKENACFKDSSLSRSSGENEIGKINPKICQNTNVCDIKLEHSGMECSNTDKDNSQDVATLKNESVPTAQNLNLASPMHVDEPSLPTSSRKDNKVNSLRKIFENESQSDSRLGDFCTPKGKHFSGIRSVEGSRCESSNKSSEYRKSTTAVVETLTVDYSQKKNLVHFNTPPVRINKRRKTLGPLNPEESSQLLQSNTSDLAMPLQDVSAAFNVQNTTQRIGIFDEKKKSAYDPEKGKEEWNRLVKNDAFMKERSFCFINPCKWKYQFRWPMELILEIPDIEVSENSRKKNISLVSNISESDHISVFINNRMKKNMSVILSEKWLNSHCKTIKDLLFTIKFVEEEYNKLEPLVNSMKYFYQEFPFDFSSDRIVFKIVNLRKEFCFEVKIDVSYGQVKGKNIDVINHVGQISKTKVQQLFDQLQPNRERFYLFWQKLMDIQDL